MNPRRWLGRDAGLPWMYGAGLLVALSLKLFYRRAGAEELEWILGPTCRLAGLLGDIPFEREAGTGWISHAHRFIVEPVCAGLNFLVVAFAVFFVTTAHRVDRRSGPVGGVGAVGAGRRALCLVACLAGAYALTVVTNALRIVAAIQLRAMDIYGSLVTPDRVHRAAGVVIYLMSLLLAYVALERAVDRWIDPRPGRRPVSIVVPVGAYLVMVLVVPLLNRSSWEHPRLFADHAAMVVAGCLAVGVIAVAADGLRRSRSGGPMPS